MYFTKINGKLFNNQLFYYSKIWTTIKVFVNLQSKKTGKQ